MNYGAKCNGATITNASTTASQNIVYSASFTPADVGKQIAVYANNVLTTTGNTHSTLIVDSLASTTGVAIGQEVVGSGIPAQTFVSAINSSTSITLTQSASTSLTGTSITFLGFYNDTIASYNPNFQGYVTLTTNTPNYTGLVNVLVNYGTDDSASINSAVAAAVSNGGGTLVLPEAQCVIAAPVVVADRVSIVGYGQNRSSLKWLSTHSQGTGYEGAITGNFSGSTSSPLHDNLFADFEIDMSNAFATTYQYYEKCIDITFMVRPTFRNLYMHDSIATCLGVDYVEQFTAQNNTIVNAGRGQTATTQDGDGIALEIAAPYTPNLESTIITGNHIINPHHYGIEVEANNATSNIVTNISHNEINTNQNNTIGIEDNGTTGAVIEGNTLISTAAAPIGFGISNRGGPLQSFNGVYGRISDNTINGFKDCVSFLPANTGGPYGNYTIDNNTCFNPTRYGVALFGVGSTPIPSMSVSRNYITGAQFAGITIIQGGGTPTFNNVTISDNILSNNGQGAIGEAAAGIYLDLSISGLKLNNNYAFDTGSGFQKFGISIGASGAITNGLFSGNHLANNATSGLDLVGTFSGEMFGNDGIANFGTIYDPTLGAGGAGTKFTISGCSTTTLVGGAAAGSFKSGVTGTCTPVITLNGATGVTAPHGWTCWSNDETTPADTLRETGSTATTVTLSGTTVSGDVIDFGCQPY